MTQQALKLALGFIEDVHIGEWQGSTERKEEVITAIKEALAQPEQEPVAWLTRDSVDGCWYATANKVGNDDKPLYTTPPQRTWVEPTGNGWFEWWRISKVADATEAEIDFADFLIIAQAVAAKLKELNNG